MRPYAVVPTTTHACHTCHLFETQKKNQVNICLVAQHNFHVASVVTLYHDCRTSKCCNRCIFSLTTCELLRHVAWCCAAFVWYIIKHLLDENIISMFYCILNIKMTSQSLSNFKELLAYGSYLHTKLDNDIDCDIILMFKM